jgi:hypothetical protein
MSLTAAATALPDPGVAYRLVIPEFDELGAAGQRLWLYLWEATRFGKTTARLTDGEIAKACGRGRRWVQKALSQLLNFRPVDADPDEPPIPLIDRFREYGPREVAGRVIRIVVRFTSPKAKEKDKATPRTKPAPTPARPPQPSPAADEPPEDPEQLRRAAAELRAAVAAAAEQGRQQAQARRTGPTMAEAIARPARTHKIKGLVDPDDVNFLELKEKLGEPLTPAQRQKLEEARGNRSP